MSILTYSAVARVSKSGLMPRSSGIGVCGKPRAWTPSPPKVVDPPPLGTTRLVLWDNRFTLHYPVNDFDRQPRLLYRRIAV